MKAKMNKYMLLISALSLLLASCGGITTDPEKDWAPAGTGEGAIRIELGGDARTAYPLLLESEFADWRWTLSGKMGSEENFKTLKVWEAGTGVDKAALSEPIGVKSGSWVFFLTAERIVEETDGETPVKKTVTTYSAQSAAVAIENGDPTVTVSFDLRLTQLDTEVSGKGSLEVSVDYTSSAVKKIEAGLYQVPSYAEDAGEGTKLVPVTPEEGAPSDKYAPQDITTAKKYALSEVPSGNYIVAFYFYDKDGNKLTANGYEEYVHIVSGALSQSSVNVTSLDDVYSITYIPSPNISAKGSFTRHSDAIYLPVAKTASDKNELDSESYLFCGWFESSDYSGTPVLQIPAGTRGNKVFYGKYINASEAKSLPNALTLTYLDNTIANDNEKNKALVGNTINLSKDTTPECSATFQWKEKADGAEETAWTAISGANTTSYKLAGSNVGNNISLEVRKTYTVADVNEGEKVLYHTISDNATDSVSAVLGGETPAKVEKGTLDFSGVTIQYSGTVIVGNKPNKASLILSGTLKDIYGNTFSNSDLAGDFDDYSALSVSKNLNITVNVDGYNMPEGSSSATVFVTVKYPAPTGAALRKITDEVGEGEEKLAEGKVAFTLDTVSMGLEYKADSADWTSVTSTQFAKPSTLVVRYKATGSQGVEGYVMSSDSSTVAITAANVGTQESQSGEPIVPPVENIVLLTGTDINKIFTTKFKTVTKFAYTTSSAPSTAAKISADESTVDVLVWKSGLTLYVTASGYTGDIPLNEDSKNMFKDMSRLTSIDLSKFKLNTSTEQTAVAYDLSGMFEGCSALATIAFGSNFNTKDVTKMSRMFYGTSALASVDVSGFDTSNVTEMDFMFASSGVTELDLSSFDTTNVTTMESMFEESYLETVTFGANFKTTGVKNMSSMFAYTSIIELDLSKFDTSNVTDMSLMFYSMSYLGSVDLSGSFSIEKATTLDGMFGGCESLSKIYVAADADWNDGVRTGEDMFEGCGSLVGGSGTVFDSENTGIAYAHVDGGTAGYFTQR